MIYMNDEAKKAKNEYMKEWRKKNKDKIKAAQERYWEKKNKEISNEEATIQTRQLITL